MGVNFSWFTTIYKGFSDAPTPIYWGKKFLQLNLIIFLKGVHSRKINCSIFVFPTFLLSFFFVFVLHCIFYANNFFPPLTVCWRVTRMEYFIRWLWCTFQTDSPARVAKRARLLRAKFSFAFSSTWKMTRFFSEISLRSFRQLQKMKLQVQIERTNTYNGKYRNEVFSWRRLCKNNFNFSKNTFNISRNFVRSGGKPYMGHSYSRPLA